MPETTNYNITLPTDGADVDTWGAENNAAHEGWDSELFRVEGLIGGKLDKAGGTMAGPLVVTTASGAFSGTFSGALTGDVSGNAATAAKLATPRNIALSGPITATGVAFDGSGSITLATAVADGALTTAMVGGLAAALAGKQASLSANQILPITYGTAPPSGTASEGAIYFKHEA